MTDYLYLKLLTDDSRALKVPSSLCVNKVSNSGQTFGFAVVVVSGVVFSSVPQIPKPAPIPTPSPTIRATATPIRRDVLPLEALENNCQKEIKALYLILERA